jgi:hypothetical protein
MATKKQRPKPDIYDQFLDEDDADARSMRRPRLKFVLNRFKLGPNRTAMVDSHLAGLCFHEARVAFVNGLDIACILLAYATVEHSVARQLLARDLIAKIGRIRSTDSLAAAQKERVISKLQFSSFEKLRQLRNLRGHPKDPDHLMGFDNLIFVRRKSPHQILETEAKQAMSILDQHWWRLPFVEVG